MEYVIGFVVAVAIIWAYFHFKGNPGFWALTRKHPDQALAFFQSDPSWMVYPGVIEDLPGGKTEWVGPFRVIDPTTNQLVKVYGRNADMDASEARFVLSVK